MKINWVTTLIAICISLLVTYGFYVFIPIEKNTILHEVTTIISFIFFILTFVLTIGVSFHEERTTAVIRITSAIFLMVGIITLIIISSISSSIPLLVILMGLLLLVYFLIIYAISKAE